MHRERYFTLDNSENYFKWARNIARESWVVILCPLYVHNRRLKEWGHNESYPCPAAWIAKASLSFDRNVGGMTFDRDVFCLILWMPIYLFMCVLMLLCASACRRLVSTYFFFFLALWFYCSRLTVSNVSYHVDSVCVNQNDMIVFVCSRIA